MSSKKRSSQPDPVTVAATYSAILDALPAHVALLDPHGVILSINKGWREFAAANGLTAAAAGIGCNYLEICDAAGGASADDARRAAAGIRAVLAGTVPEFTFEYACHSPVESRWFRMRVGAVAASPAAALQGGVVVMHLNVTERRLAEDGRQMQAQMLKESEQKHRELAAQLAEERARLVAAQAVAKIGSWETDLHTMMVVWSDETHRIFGSAPSSGPITHEGFLARVHPADRASVDAAFRHVVEGQGFGTIEHRIVLPDGEIKTVEENWRVFRDDTGKPRRALGTCQDITDRKKLEQQFLRAQRMESVGTLAGGIAHDLNNVLAPILMAAELLEDEVTTDEARELLATVHESAERGANLVKQVLSFARGVHSERVTVNPVSLVRDIVKVMRETFPKSISAGMTAAEGLWTLTGDPTQVHQVLMNLCVNARDAMPDGGSIGVSLDNVVLDETYAAMTLDAKAGSYVLVRVTDTGTGIPPEVRDRIFEPFFTMKEVGKGTGLGLSTTLAIVKSHSGFITVESEVGAGTTFSVYFPANVTDASGEREAATRPALPRGHGELILVVDDEHPIRQMVERTLETFGYRVISASNGAEAVAVYADNASGIAAVVTDMAMPIMDGPTMIVALRAIKPSVKVIGSSGLDNSSSIGRALSGGLEHFVSKPYTADALLTILAKVLSTP